MLLKHIEQNYKNCSMYLINLAAIIIGHVFATGYPNISIPDAGNCGDDTLIMCDITAIDDDWGLLRNGKLLISKTAPINDPTKKYSLITARKDVIITIHNTNVFTDAGKYSCFSGFRNSSTVTLALECKARNIQVTTDETYRLQITADQLFPNNATFTTMIDSQLNVEGNGMCKASEAYKGYYKCVWRSSFPLDDGTYSYNVTVKTITESEIFSGVINIGRPCIASNITVKNIQITSATLSWTPCSYGGFYQAFFIQISRDNVSWINLMFDDRRNTSFTPESYDLHSLEASSVYFVRLAASNDTEVINYSDTVEFRTLSENPPNAEYTKEMITGLVVGTIIILMIISCVVFICKYKKSVDASNIHEMSDNTNYSNQDAHVSGPSRGYERNTGDMIYVNRALDNQVSGRPLYNQVSGRTQYNQVSGRTLFDQVSGSTLMDRNDEDSDDVVFEEDEDRS